jgi:hypothetical protein
MMDIGPYTKKQIYETFAEWHVPQEFAHPLYNYLVYGFTPGGCFTAVLANDWHRAVMSSHPGNTITALKAATGWIHDRVPSQARGSYEAVDAWSRLDSEVRRSVLEHSGLVLPSRTETFKALRGESTVTAPLDYYNF